MKCSKYGLLALTLLSLPLLAINLAPLEPSHSEAPPVAAARILQSGTFAKVLNSHYTQAEISKGVYIGANFCLACHKDYAAFSDTQHATFMRRPMTQYTMVPKKGVIADLNQNGKDDFIDGLDFNTISSVFDAYKPNAPKLSVKDGIYLVSINGVDYPVVATLGGGPAQGQRFVVRIPVTDTDTKFTKSLYFAPFAWDPVANAYTANSPTSWYDAANKPRFGPATTMAQVTGISNYEAACMGCHVTGIRSLAKASTGEWVLKGYAAVLYAADDPAYVDLDGDGTYELTCITCESCHGPGSTHVLYAGDPTKIVNPKTLTAAQQVELCQQCHTTMASTPNKTFGYPYKDDSLAGWYPGIGEPVASYYIDTTAYWPDGKLQKSGRPFGDYHTSLHATNTFETVACSTCHNPHQRTTNERQLIDSMVDATTNLTIKTSPENNTLCLGCHATHGPFVNITKEMTADYDKNEEAIGKEVSAHSNHPYAPDRIMGLSRCIGCHMANTGGSHSWRAVAPELTLKYQAQGGMPNSCAAGCHNQLVNIFGLGMKAGTAWNTTYDQSLATILQKYYGPGGTWWDTKGAPMAKTPAATSH